MRVENGQHRLNALTYVLNSKKIAKDDRLKRQIPAVVYVQEYLTEGALTELRVNAQSEKIVKPDTLVERLWKLRAAEEKTPGCLGSDYVREHFVGIEESPGGVNHLLALARMDPDDPVLFGKTLELLNW